MGDESYGGDVLFYVGGDGGHQVAVFVQHDILQAHGYEFLAELLEEGELLVGTGLTLGVRVRRGVECHVPQKSVNYFFHI